MTWAAAIKNLRGAGKFMLRSLSFSALIVLLAAAAASSSSSQFTICANQTYALCATASCFVFEGLAYCECNVMSGNSITETDSFDDGQNACTVNAAGVDNGYMVSTFSLPDSVLAGGNQALYTCPAGTSNGAYAQCDGGLCFTSTQGKSFPGFDQPLGPDQIICSCPVTVANPATTPLGYQIVGPFPCQKAFFKNCRSVATNKMNGAQIFVGAPTGVPRLLTRQLDGSVPNLNRCP